MAATYGPCLGEIVILQPGQYGSQGEGQSIISSFATGSIHRIGAVEQEGGLCCDRSGASKIGCFYTPNG
ncbi:hypothetical protein LshimejAT787_1101920 [Lyophyllum shimeji]|uniref:Uncharacterized protein n=1 Tax=Lyophyllum shimeji TaxID=47721 RepID=A0A9P3URF3_LYOSH|nr:hypothetical protein LshimejAT787_1101920 [Lyophyllum shimeji]